MATGNSGQGPGPPPGPGGACTEIPFWIHDRPKWVSGISRQTTCQDILHALVRAERKAANLQEVKPAKSEKSEDLTCRKISRQLALVEQWRGVERPLSGSSRILKLWNAWGEEKSQVKFVIKRISSSSSASSLVAPPVTAIHHPAPSLPGASNGGGTLPLPRQRKPRRRNSRASACSSLRGTSTRGSSGGTAELGADDLYKRSETVHPKAFLKRGKGSSGSQATLMHDDIERLMRIILTQGETIHSQLRRLREREGQIESFEQQVHDTRTKTAGKDYLLNAYLDTQQLSASSTDDERQQTGAKYKYNRSPSKGDPSSLSEMVQSLNQICTMNERLQLTEEKINDLNHQIGSGTGPGFSPSNPVHHQEEELSMSARRELKELIGLNDKYGQEIDYNRHLISTMRLAFDERRALMAKLEEDVSSVESEGHQLQLELKSIQESRQKQTLELLHQMERAKRMAELEPPEEEEEESEDEMPILFADAAFLHSASETPTHQESGAMLNGHYQISNEQLYDTTVTSGHLNSDPRALYDELQRRLHIKTSMHHHEAGALTSTFVDPNNRISATGSPGSASSSGNSSGSSGCAYLEKSVRFSDREQVLATPDLPELPPESEEPSSSSAAAMGAGAVMKQSGSKKSKPILKSPSSEHHHQSSSRGGGGPNANPGDTDSNSDTGLSSLHSSSDEGTYVLDTLV